MKIGELKKDAKVKLTGNYKKALLFNLIYLVIVYGLAMLGNLMGESILSVIYEAIVLIFTLPLSYGVVASTMKIVRNEDVSATDFLKIGFSNIKSTWRVTGRTIVKMLLPVICLIISYAILFTSLLLVFEGSKGTEGTILFIVSTILVVASLIWTVIKSFSYSLTFYILYDKQDATGKEITEKSAELMKGNKLTLFLLSLSFIGWYLLIYLAALVSVIILGELAGTVVTAVLTLLLTPYVTAATICFYEELLNKGDNPISSEE